MRSGDHLMLLCVGLDLQPGAAGFTMTTTPTLETVTLIASLNVSYHVNMRDF